MIIKKFNYIFSTKCYYYFKIIKERNDYFIGYSIKNKKKYILKKNISSKNYNFYKGHNLVIL
jgi:hypothetical protein